MAEQRSYQRERGRDEDREAPPVGAASAGQESVQSASPDAQIPDALGNRPSREPQNRLADKTVVKEFGKDDAGNTITAAATPLKNVDVGPFGMALPQSGELMGGHIEKVLESPFDDEAARQPLTKERAAMMTKVYQKLAALVNRPISEWGIIGPGDVVRGHHLYLDLHSGQKVRAMDGHRVNEGELYANLRQFPESLATGDTIEKVLGS